MTYLQLNKCMYNCNVKKKKKKVVYSHYGNYFTHLNPTVKTGHHIANVVYILYHIKKRQNMQIIKQLSIKFLFLIQKVWKYLMLFFKF